MTLLLQVDAQRIEFSDPARKTLLLEAGSKRLELAIPAPETTDDETSLRIKSIPVTLETEDQ